jgi:hypothetical protein
VTSIKARAAVGGAALLVGAVAVVAVLKLGGANAGEATGTANVRSGQGAGVDGRATSGGAGAGTGAPGSQTATPYGARAGAADEPAPAQPSAPTPANLHGVLGPLEQAVSSGGHPRPLTREEVETLLRSELRKVGINQP